MLNPAPSRWVPAFLCAAAALPSPALAGGASYTLIDLGIAPGLNASVGVDVNAMGQAIIEFGHDARAARAATAERNQLREELGRLGACLNTW